MRSRTRIGATFSPAEYDLCIFVDSLVRAYCIDYQLDVVCVIIFISKIYDNIILIVLFFYK